jgi:hypothetical protein
VPPQICNSMPTLDTRETFVQLRVIKATATRYSAAEHELGQYQFQLKVDSPAAALRQSQRHGVADRRRAPR